MKKRKLKRWVKVVLSILIVLDILVFISEVENITLFILTKTLAILMILGISNIMEINNEENI